MSEVASPVGSKEFLKLCAWTALASLLISVWCVLTNDVINDDGILYVHTARLFAEGNATVALDAMGSSRWPFYPWLIAVSGQSFGIDLEWAAHALNAIALAIAAIFFLAIIRELRPQRTILILAALIFLIFPTVNEYRDQIIRDQGYIAWYLASVWTFLRYYLHPSFVRGMLWLVAAIVAALFRIEGVAFLLLLPLLFLVRGRFRELAVYTAYPYLILVVGVSVAALLFFGTMPSSLDQLRLSEPLTVLQHLAASSGASGLARLLTASKDYLVQASPVPRYAPMEYSPAVALGTFLIVLIGEICHTITPLYLALAAYGLWKAHVFPSREARAVWLGFVAVNLLVLCTRLGDVFFLTERHPLALALTLMLAVPFGLDRLFCTKPREAADPSIQPHTGLLSEGGQRCSPVSSTSRLHRWLRVGVILLLVYGTVDGLTSFGPGKGYLKEAGLWIKGRARNNESVFSNDPVVAYYAGRVESDSITGSGSDRLSAERVKTILASHTWIALHDRSGGANLQQTLELMGLAPPAQVFSNKKGRRVLVFGPRSEPGDYDRSQY